MATSEAMSVRGDMASPKKECVQALVERRRGISTPAALGSAGNGQAAEVPAPS